MGVWKLYDLVQTGKFWEICGNPKLYLLKMKRKIGLNPIGLVFCRTQRSTGFVQLSAVQFVRRSEVSPVKLTQLTTRERFCGRWRVHEVEQWLLDT
jgi:hypothetical protein